MLKCDEGLGNEHYPNTQYKQYLDIVLCYLARGRRNVLDGRYPIEGGGGPGGDGLGQGTGSRDVAARGRRGRGMSACMSLLERRQSILCILGGT